MLAWTSSPLPFASFTKSSTSSCFLLHVKTCRRKQRRSLRAKRNTSQALQMVRSTIYFTFAPKAASSSTHDLPIPLVPPVFCTIALEGLCHASHRSAVWALVCTDIRTCDESKFPVQGCVSPYGLLLGRHRKAQYKVVSASDPQKPFSMDYDKLAIHEGFRAFKLRPLPSDVATDEGSFIRALRRVLFSKGRKTQNFSSNTKGTDHIK